MIIAIVGPTGVGKTAVSIALAKHFKAEIINFDAMQVYEKLDIGTAKVKEEEKEGIIHHLLSFIPLTTNYSVYDYQKDARCLIEKLQQKNKNIILVGGTGLYLKAVLYDYRFTKGKTNKTYDELTNEEILERIKKYEQEVYPHVNNRRRLIRLLNKLENGEEIGNDGSKPLYNFKIIGLTAEREELYKRINDRVDKMMEEGLEKEVLSLREFFPISKALQTGIGYKEFIPYLEGKCEYDEVIRLIKRNSRRYAKRQFTFFKNQFNTNWYTVSFTNFEKTLKEIISDLDNDHTVR